MLGNKSPQNLVHKPTHTYYLTTSAGQESGCGLRRFSASQSLPGCKGGGSQGRVASQGLAGAEPASKLTCVSRIQSLHGYWTDSLIPYWLEGHPQFPVGWKAILSSLLAGRPSSVPYWLEGHPQFPTGWKAILSSLLAGRPSSVLCLVGVSSMVAVSSECASPEGNEVRKMKSQCFANLTTSHYLCLILLVGNNSQGPVYPKEGVITQEWDTRKQG